MDVASVDVGSWPLVRLRFPAGPLGDSGIDRMIEQLESFLASGERHAILADALQVRQAATPRQMWRFARWTNDHRAALAAQNVGVAIVFQAAIARGILAAYNWMTGGHPSPQILVDTVEEGERWCLTRLAMAGVHLDVVPHAHSSGRLPRSEVDSLAEHVPSLVRRIVETYGPVVDMFREAAFLVDARGAPLHANDAARLAYAAPPSWLGSALSEGPRSSFPDCRIMQLAGAPEVYLVIPCPSLQPNLEATARPRGLPPSLERIANLLAQGLPDKDIARELELPLATVRTYVARIYRKLGVSRRGELVRRWRDIGRS
jgi:DNA-binding CsgD family transcriptional regulator